VRVRGRRRGLSDRRHARRGGLMDADEQPRSPEHTDGLVHLAAALQRLGMTMTGIDRLSVSAIHRIAEILDTEPAPRRAPPNPDA
jgi:hypothetical protein